MAGIIQSRRGFISGLGALFVAAPAIVRAASIMPVRAIREPTIEEINALLRARMDEAYRVTRESMARLLYGDYEGNPRFSGYGGGFNVPIVPYPDGEFSLKEWVIPIELPPELA
jgi:hypothetical protein